MHTVSIVEKNMMMKECLLLSVDLNILEALRKFQNMILILQVNGLEVRALKKSTSKQPIKD